MSLFVLRGYCLCGNSHLHASHIAANRLENELYLLTISVSLLREVIFWLLLGTVQRIDLR